MLALLRLAAILLIGLTVIYACLLLWLRAGERARLEAEWEAERPPLPRHTHVGIGLAAHRRRTRRKLIWGVYLVPIAAICALIWYLNYT